MENEVEDTNSAGNQMDCGVNIDTLVQEVQGDLNDVIKFGDCRPILNATKKSNRAS